MRGTGAGSLEETRVQKQKAGLILAEVEYEKMPMEADSNDVVTSYVAKDPRRVLIP